MGNTLPGGEQLIIALRQASYSVRVMAGASQRVRNHFPRDKDDRWYLGSAIAISPYHLLTAWHVVEPGRGRLPVLTSELNLPSPVVVEVVRGVRDIALLRVENPLPVFIPPAIGRWHQVASPGDMVLTWASHAVVERLRPFAIKAGYMVGSAVDIDRKTDFALSLPVIFGVSGAGVLHVPSGRIIGVITHKNVARHRLPGGKDASISFAADGFDIAYATGLFAEGQVIHRSMLNVPGFRWWSREIQAGSIGALTVMLLYLIIGRR